MIAKLQQLPLREVWEHEATNFTPWLEENLDILSDAIGPTLSGARREQAAGDFSVDLIAEDAEGNPVVIENQLEASDHDHLGKLITYMAAREAKKGIWIIASPRQEHVQAVSWLNKFSPTDFYLIKLEAVRIENSPPAPLFTVIVGPSREIRQIGRAKSEWTGDVALRRKFLTELQEKAKTRTELFANASIATHELRMNAGKPGLTFELVIYEHKAVVQLAIDPNREKNREFLKKLEEARPDIDTNFGESLEWHTKNIGRCFIYKGITKGGYHDEEQWSEIQGAMIEAMVKLEKALKPHIEAFS
jgi:hypothetical protein